MLTIRGDLALPKSSAPAADATLFRSERKAKGPPLTALAAGSRRPAAGIPSMMVEAHGLSHLQPATETISLSVR